MGVSWINTVDRVFRRNVEKTDNCWIWKGYISPYGYGRLTFNGKAQPAHRFVYEILKGPVPEGMVCDHLCRNRACVNPDHIEIVTHRVNILRGEGMSAKNVIKTHCASGHPYDGDNLFYSQGNRHCRICSRESMWRYRLRRQQACKT